MDESRPLVTVLMTVYNGESFLREAIDSILGQTFDDFEFLVIDDGSVDRTLDITASYKDERIRIERNERNMGIGVSANRGLELSRGKYIARIDCDDISLPERLEKEVDVLENNRELVIVGSAYHVIDTNGHFIRTETPPLTDTMIRWKLLFDSSFAHSSVMFRSDIIRSEKLEYCAEAPWAEEVELWSRILEFGKGMNLEEPLIKYRIHTNRVSEQHETEQMKSARGISFANIEKLGFNVTEEIEILRGWYFRRPSTLSERDIEVFKLLFSIISRFEQKNGIDPVQVGAIRRQWVVRAFRAAISSGNFNLATVRFLINITFRGH